MELQSWSPGPRCFCEELIFVPGPNGATQEDDGVLLGMVFDGETQRSSLVVRPRVHPPGVTLCGCFRAMLLLLARGLQLKAGWSHALDDCILALFASLLPHGLLKGARHDALFAHASVDWWHQHDGGMVVCTVSEGDSGDAAVGDGCVRLQ